MNVIPLTNRPDSRTFMLATAPADSTRRAHEKTVRLSPGDLPAKPLPSTTIDHDAQTVRGRAASAPTRPLPKAISAFDGKTERLPPLDLPAVAAAGIGAGQTGHHRCPESCGPRIDHG